MPWIDWCVNFRHFAAGCRSAILLDLLLPDRCPGCAGAAPAGGGYCAACAAALDRHQCQCRVCGAPVTAPDRCGRCQRNPPPFYETIAPFAYTEPLSGDIHKLKYRGRLACGRDLGILLADELALRGPALPDAMVPVPLHWRRRVRRGFNQSHEIALAVSRRLGIPIRPDLVRRARHTPPQVGLSPPRRRANMRRVFSPTGVPVPARVAIVDDVVTSGATVSALADCLRRAGAERISVWAVARV